MGASRVTNAKRRIGRAAWGLLVVVTVIGVLPSTVGAQEAAGSSQSEITVRITAQRIDDRRTEFALQRREADDSWGERLLPTRRFFPAGVRVGRWLVSTPLSVLDAQPQSAAPAVRFTAIAAGSDYSCGLRTSGTVQCWGERARGVPSSQFTQIDAGSNPSCGLRRDGTIECWGISLGELEELDEQYLAVSAGIFHACAIRTDRTIACAGGTTQHPYGQLDAPEGRFTAISTGPFNSCALGTNGAVTCWGRSGAIPPPNGVRFTRP